MKNLIPLIALLMFGTSFGCPVLAGDKECQKKCEKNSDDCCKEGKSEKKAKKTKASAAKEEKKDAETKPAETKPTENN